MKQHTVYPALNVILVEKEHNPENNGGKCFITPELTNGTTTDICNKCDYSAIKKQKTSFRL